MAPLDGLSLSTVDFMVRWILVSMRYRSREKYLLLYVGREEADRRLRFLAFQRYPDSPGIYSRVGEVQYRVVGGWWDFLGSRLQDMVFTVA